MNLPFSATIAREAVEAAARSYNEATIQSELAHVLIVQDGATVIVAFRGTQSIRDWFTDFDSRQVECAGAPGVMVHHGFLTALTSVAQTLCERLEATPHATLIVTGHSLGGALAMMAAPFLRAKGYAPDYVFTFGQPRVGNRAFCQGYNGGALRVNTWRFVNENDIVPRVPFVTMGYRHAGQCVFFPQPVRGFALPPVINPSIWRMLASDAVGVFEDYEALQRARLELGAFDDHHVERYQRQVAALTGEQVGI